MASLAFLRENNKNEEEEVEEEEDSLKTWRRENNTDLTLGWTVG